MLSWVGSSFSISSAIPFSKQHFFQTDNQKAVLFTVFSLFKLFFSCGGKKKAYLKRGHCFARKFSIFTELPENYIYLNQSELSNFSMYIINAETECYL